MLSIRQSSAPSRLLATRIVLRRFVPLVLVAVTEDVPAVAATGPRFASTASFQDPAPPPPRPEQAAGGAARAEERLQKQLLEGAAVVDFWFERNWSWSDGRWTVMQHRAKMPIRPIRPIAVSAVTPGEIGRNVHVLGFQTAYVMASGSWQSFVLIDANAGVPADGRAATVSYVRQVEFGYVVNLDRAHASATCLTAAKVPGSACSWTSRSLHGNSQRRSSSSGWASSRWLLMRKP